ncbi:MAG: hypothetical protein ABII89_07800 [Candidatus Omnitrophota bacterium]
MLKKISIAVGSIVFLLLGFKAVKAADLALKPYLYTQNFEGEADPVQEIGGGWGAFTVNFKGLTREKSFSGKKSFKLDITFKDEGAYCFWAVPTTVPAEGKLQFSGYILLDEESIGKAGLGLNFISSTNYGASDSFDAYESTKGEWKLIEGDPVKMSKGIKSWMMGRNDWPLIATEENFGLFVKGVGIFLHGGKGQRVIVYVDNLKIEGEAPSEEAYREEMEKRWFSVKEKTAEKISSWEKTVQKLEKELDSLADSSPDVTILKEAAREEGITPFKIRVAKIKENGFFNSADIQEINSLIERLENVLHNIKEM